MSELARLEQEFSALKSSVESFSKDMRSDIKALQKLITASAVSEVEISHIKSEQKQIKQRVEAYGKRLHTLEQASLLSTAKSKNNEWVIRLIIAAVFSSAAVLLRGVIS